MNIIKYQRQSAQRTEQMLLVVTGPWNQVSATPHSNVQLQTHASLQHIRIPQEYMRVVGSNLDSIFMTNK